MNSRTRKYVESRKASKEVKKEAASIAPAKKEKPADRGSKEITTTSIKRGQPEIAKGAATQDDTGGGHESGKRIDEN